eukprot:gene14830-31495_t
MVAYFANPCKFKAYRGSTPSKIASLLRNDLALAGLSFLSLSDLVSMRQLAQNRLEWKVLSNTILEARERVLDASGGRNHGR